MLLHKITKFTTQPFFQSDTDSSCMYELVTGLIQVAKLNMQSHGFNTDNKRNREFSSRPFEKATTLLIWGDRGVGDGTQGLVPVRQALYH